GLIIICNFAFFFFFFSSRRRHTRFSRDWSSDVCSSDLTSFATKRNYMAKSTSLSVLISLIIGGGWLFSDIYTPNHYKKYSYNLWADVNHSFVQLDETSNAFRQGSISLDSLQNTLSKARETYKKSELLLSFYFPEYVNENINGAPLLGTEVENPKPLLNE